MKGLLLILLLSTSQFLYAQDPSYYPDMRSWMINGSDTSNRYIFADTAFIRISPDTKQAPIDTLLAGDNITVTGVSTNSLSIRGIKGPWLNISYTKNGESKTGYVWQGLVSLSPLRRGDTRFVFGIERRADSIYQSGKSKDTVRRYLVRLKVVQNSKILAKAAIIIPDDESANTSGGRLMSGMGLTNVQHIIVLAFSGEACGVPSYDYYLAWTKDSMLVRFPDKMNVGDAGAFYHSENFTFPNEKNGKPDMIIWNMIVEEDTEKTDKNGEPILKVTEKKNISYAWDAVNRKVTEAKK